MPQANTVQREPSMEEILASIRRIIEDGDAPRLSGLRDGVDDMQDETLPDVDAAPEIEAFRNGLGSDIPMSEVAHGMPGQFAKTGLLMPEVEIEAVTVQHHLGQGQSNSPAIDQEVGFQDREQPRLASGHRANQDDEQAALSRPSAANGAVHAAAATEPRGSIISESAGRQVAAAFGELSDAFAASRRRSFDEIAEEMLRPMLQDWLDNNLPMMVERLVREEIERIARGGAR